MAHVTRWCCSTQFKIIIIITFFKQVSIVQVVKKCCGASFIWFSDTFSFLDSCCKKLKNCSYLSLYLQQLDGQNY